MKNELVCGCGCNEWHICEAELICRRCGFTVKFHSIDFYKTPMQKKYHHSMMGFFSLGLLVKREYQDIQDAQKIFRDAKL